MKKNSCTKLQPPPEPLTGGLPPPDPRYVCKRVIIIIYQAVRRFHIFLRPLNTYSIFFLRSSLSFQSSSTSPFSPISPRIPSAQLCLGLPRFLLPGGFHFIACFGSLPSSILWTYPYHFSCLVLISSERDLVTFIFCLIIVFLILSFLESRTERRQKSPFL